MIGRERPTSRLLCAVRSANVSFFGSTGDQSKSIRMTKRVCYIHVGPHKTGTKAIQWFLKEHRDELLKHGCFVPESGNTHGGDHAIARKLCGQELPNNEEPSVAIFVQMMSHI